jgi:hypothetical protein
VLFLRVGDTMSNTNDALAKLYQELGQKCYEYYEKSHLKVPEAFLSSIVQIHQFYESRNKKDCCPNCYADVDSKWKYCMACGTKLR